MALQSHKPAGDLTPKGENGHGGLRPNSGRKPRLEKFSSAIAAAEKRIGDRLPFLVDKAFELAEGVEVHRVSSTGKVRIYSQPPDIKAIAYLVDRIMGKPRQSIEMGGQDGGPIIIAYVNDWRSAGPHDEIEYADPAALPPPRSGSS